MINISVAGILANNENKILLGKRKPGGSVGGLWEFPGGKVENKESNEKALIREFKEELNIDITISDFIISKDFVCSQKEFKLFAYYIKANNYNFSKKEHTEFKWLSISDINNMRSDLVDSDRILLDDIKDFFNKKSTII